MNKQQTAILIYLFFILAFSTAFAAPIHDAAAKGDIAKITALLSVEPKLINATDKDGATPLHYAVASDKSDIVKLLLNKKANVNAKKKNGVTPLHIAAAMGYMEIAELLIASGANTSAKDQNGRTPLDLSVKNQHADIANLLRASATTYKTGVQQLSDITCQSLVTKSEKPYWLTYPMSRLVINPMLFMNAPAPDGLYPSLPMNVGYYFYDYPVPMPWLWSWTPGTMEEVATAAIPGPEVTFRQDQTSAWDPRGINADFTGNIVKLTVPQVTGGGTGGGALITTTNAKVDLDNTPILFIQVNPARGGGAAWVVKGVGEGGSDKNMVPDSQDPGGFFTNVATTMGWTGTKSFELRLFACGAPGAQVTYTGLRFMGIRGQIPSFTPINTTWTPNLLVTEAESKQPKMLVRTTTCFVDESTITQSMDILRSEPQTLILSGQFPGERIYWDQANRRLLLIGKGYHAAIAVGNSARFLGIFPTWGDWLANTPKPDTVAGIWAVAFDNLKTGDHLVVTASLSPNNTSMVKTLNVSSQQNFQQSSRQSEKRWNDLLGQVPHPQDFQLHKVNSRGIDAAAIKNMYYKAWAFLLSDTIPPTPENEFSYSQVLCGKASMWRDGTPKALGSCQWESAIGMQFLALVDPKTAWESFEGQMSAVGPDGAIGGECLPTRNTQTAWILYALTNDKERLRKVYPVVKRLLIWKTAHALPDIAPARAYPERESIDHEWYVHALMDAIYAKRIAIELNLADEQAYWQNLIQRMTDLYPKWFWDSSGVYVEQTDRIGGYCGPNYHLGVQGLILPPEILKERERDSLVKLYRSLVNKESPFMIAGLGRHPNYHYTTVGLWQYGFVDDMVMMTEAAMRDITSAGEFGENYSKEYPLRTEGVCPDVFGAALMIDSVLWHNGIILGDGLPIIAHIPNAVGVENIMVLGAPINVKWDKTGGGVTLWGNGLKNLKLPTGFKVLITQDGAPKWYGEIPVGKQIALESAISG